MRAKLEDRIGFYILGVVAIFGLFGTIAGGIVMILNALAVSGYFIVDVIR